MTDRCAEYQRAVDAALVELEHLRGLGVETVSVDSRIFGRIRELGRLPPPEPPRRPLGDFVWRDPR